MSATTTATDQPEGRKCRLCLGNFLTNEAQTGLDIMDSIDIRKLLREVYELQVLPEDSNTTMMCMPCYQQLITDYKFRMKLFTLRKTFKFNQTMLVAQIVAFRSTSETSADSTLDCDGRKFAPMREVSTQTEAPQQPNASSSIATPSLVNGTVENVVEQQQCNSEPATRAIQILQLIPVVVDCVKDSSYLKALRPLQVSMNPNDPAPLMYMCSRCYNTFEGKKEWEHHEQVMDCVPSCRYCFKPQTADHCCADQVTYSAINKHIVGSDKYVTTYAAAAAAAANNPIPASIPDESVDGADQAPNDEPKNKRLKLDANHNGQDTSTANEFSTPNHSKGGKHQTVPEMRVSAPGRETSLPNSDMLVINLSSSEGEDLLQIVEPKAAAKRCVIQQFLNQVYMAKQHPSAAVSFEAECIERITSLGRKMGESIG
uniref:ZAD domain-containing protein n=1 Tax=Anopheles minimus TaxID=112268 RepID=A0A182W1R3_9DIPT